MPSTAGLHPLPPPDPGCRDCSTLGHVNMPFGIALVENGYGHLSLIEAVPAARDLRPGTGLLKLSRQRLGRLPGEQIDVLFIDEIGKNISGDGADPNVINRDISGVLRRAELNLKPLGPSRDLPRPHGRYAGQRLSGIGLGDSSCAAPSTKST